MNPFKLPDGFLFGSATAATQIEGGDKNNNWYDWCQQGKIKDGASTVRADDHWERYEEDTGLMVKLNQQVYRMGIEWSRIEPEKGKFDDEAMAHYRKEIELLIKNGIKPLVTLHHFTHPMWLVKEGGFETEAVIPYFVRYTRYVIEHIGDLVTDYVTINEPNVYVVNGYFFGSWPPGKKSFKMVLKVYTIMTLCHFESYKAIHEIRKERGFAGETMVGVANHMRVFVPYNRANLLDRLAAFTMNFFFQSSILKYMTKGRLNFPASLFVKNRKGSYADFLGVNYYTRSSVHFKGFRDDVPPGRPLNDLGWEIYPEGLYLLCKKYYERYKLPIWVTENGTCDNHDTFRAQYLADHLAQIKRATDEGIRVERYYHWSLLDNFEWLDGESARFGLVHVDYETQERKIKRSGELYAEICKEGGITKEMIEKYNLK